VNGKLAQIRQVLKRLSDARTSKEFKENVTNSVALKVILELFIILSSIFHDTFLAIFQEGEIQDKK